MSKNVVYFAHGQESGPWGTKITILAEVARSRGFHVESPDYSVTRNPDERVRMLRDIHPTAEGTLVLAGSSMGGYVSAASSGTLQPSGLFLLAPAFYMPEFALPDPSPCAGKTQIIHGWNDDVVPVENSIRYARAHKASLQILDSDHRLTDVIGEIARIFDGFLFEALGNIPSSNEG